MATTRTSRCPSLPSARCSVQHAYITTCCHVITPDYLVGTIFVWQSRLPHRNLTQGGVLLLFFSGIRELWFSISNDPPEFLFIFISIIFTMFLHFFFLFFTFVFVSRWFPKTVSQVLPIWLDYICISTNKHVF